MSRWKSLKLEEILDFYNGKKVKPFQKGKYPVYGSNGIIGFYDDYNFENGIIIGRVGAYCGSVNINTSKFWSSDNTIVVQPEANNSITCLYYMLQTMKLNNYAGGSAQPLLTQRVLKNLKIKIPDIKTQEKIADVLSTYDKLIENNNRRIEILEETAEEIYKEWFVRMRFPGYENTKFEKGIPEGWQVKKVGDIARFKRGKNLRVTDAIAGDVPVIAGGIEPSCYHNESNTRAPVITVSASGANAGYTKFNYVDVWASDCSYIDIEDTELIYYLYLLLKVSHKEIMNLQIGAAQPHVYAKDLNDFKFMMPNMELVVRLNEIAKDIFNKIKYLFLSNQNLIKQRDLLLPRLMNGTIEVK